MVFSFNFTWALVRSVLFIFLLLDHFVRIVWHVLYITLEIDIVDADSGPFCCHSWSLNGALKIPPTSQREAEDGLYSVVNNHLHLNCTLSRKKKGFQWKSEHSCSPSFIGLDGRQSELKVKRADWVFYFFVCFWKRGASYKKKWFIHFGFSLVKQHF